MRKIISGLLGIGLLLHTYAADCASREELGLPLSKEEQCIEEGVVSSGLYAKVYRSTGSGKEDMFEGYLLAPGRNRPDLGQKPFALHFDRNHNGKIDPGEFYISRGMDEDWEQQDDILK